jgi:hypothetical protein
VRQYNRIINLFLLIIPCTGILFSSPSDYLLIEDFEDEVADFYRHGLMGDQWVIHSMWPEVATGAISEFPIGSGNQAFWGDLSIAEVSTGGNHTFTSIALDPVIDPQNPETATAIVYFQYHQVGSSKRFHFYASDMPVIKGDDPETVDVVESFTSAPITYAELEAIIILNQGNELGMRDAGNYHYTLDFVPQNGVWYEFWCYLDSAATTYTLWVRELGSTDEPLLIREYDGYREGSPGDQTGETYEEYYFRRGEGNPLATIGFAYNADGDNDKWFVDDLFINYSPTIEAETLRPSVDEIVTPAGATLKDMTTDTWMGYPVVEVDGSRWADTGDWLGWVQLASIDESGTGWLFIQSTEGWAYTSADSVTDSGGWIFFLK